MFSGMRLYFQGSGYTESPNYEYKTKLMDPNILFPEIPEKILEISKRRLQQKEVAEPSVK